MIKLVGVNKTYGKGYGKVEALKNINIEIPDARFIAIIGPSGCGKTTLLNIMSTVDYQSEGEIWYNDIKISDLSEKKRAKLRLENFGFIYQKYYLLPTLNVFDNIVTPGVFSNKKIDMEYLESLLSMLGLDDKKESMSNCLSGGEQQRVAIARAMVNNPDVIFADEPTGNLDSVNGNKVMSYLISCVRDYKKTVIMVTHNMEYASMADIVINLKDGVIVG